MDNEQGEVLRYLGRSGQEITPELGAMVEECMRSLREAVTPRYVRAEFDAARKENGILLENAGVLLTGGDICRHLNGCIRAVLFAATLGIGADNLIRGRQVKDITGALILDACASFLIEELCDKIEETIRDEANKEGMEITSRYSPGYGDLPLSLQPRLLAVLDAERKIGLTCTENYILLPRKSVTAVIGLGAKLHEGVDRCEGCSLKETCDYRRR